jgi:hypothetical protein
MLEFALAYHAALDNVTGDREMKLGQYEMDEEEWEIAQQLGLVLKVRSTSSFTIIFSLNQYLLDFQRCYFVLLARWYSKYRYCNSSHGLYQ